MRVEAWPRAHPRGFGWGLLVVLLLLGYLHWHGWYQRGPNGIHEWAQADRLAIALQYRARGMDFVRPRTLDVRPPDQVVGVELPLQAYLAASVGRVFGPGAISSAFRLLRALAMLLGLWRLFIGWPGLGHARWRRRCWAWACCIRPCGWRTGPTATPTPGA